MIFEVECDKRRTHGPDGRNDCSFYCIRYFRENIFDKNIFGKNIFGKNIFFWPFPYLIALQTTPPLLTPSLGIFEVKCDGTNELTDWTDAMIVPFIVLDVV